MTYEEYLAVPYILVVESVERPDGEWTRRASYPELPGCVVEADSPWDAIEQLEEKRRRRIAELLAAGESVPVPRPPLRSSLLAIDPGKLEFARWLVDQGHVTDQK